MAKSSEWNLIRDDFLGNGIRIREKSPAGK